VRVETVVVSFVKKVFGPHLHTQIFMKEDRACGAGAAAAACDDPAAPRRAFIDAAIIALCVAILVELDEGLHRYYNAICELARYDKMTFGHRDWAGKPLVIIRFNPDGCSRLFTMMFVVVVFPLIGSVVREICEQRCKTLAQVMRNEAKMERDPAIYSRKVSS